MGCEAIQPFTGGQPFDLAAWAEQYAAWWSGWQEHRDEQPQEEPDIAAPPVEEDKFIPAGSNAALPRTYAPPDEPAFALESSDTPSWLLRPLQDWFESPFDQDWERRARAWPDIDSPLDEYVNQIKERMTGEAYGTWAYAREVEGWWIEGARAHVRILGVEHYMPMDDDPCENNFERWDFALRKRDDDWTIHTYSAERLEAPPRDRGWVKAWRKGKIG